MIVLVARTAATCVFVSTITIVIITITLIAMDTHKRTWRSIEEAPPIVFQGHPSNFEVTPENHRFWPELSVSGL